MRNPAIFLATALLLLPSAAADAEPNMAGQWTFTARLEIDCTFGGIATLVHQGDGKYTAELTATQSCPALPEDFIVRQECDASQSGNQVSVRCDIVEFVNGYQSGLYYPDNFALTIASPARMHGALLSTGDAKPAEWLRAEGAIS